ncbi:MAG: methionine ABC transporter ATP-binding protein, partial [Alphaproteobacteria bacterium 65-37]
DVDLSVREGAIVGVIGRSGAGKSTLIRLINGLERPSAGRVVVNGTEITSLDERSLRQVRRSIGMIFQHFNLLSSRTVFDNIALPLEIAGATGSQIDKAVTPLLDLVGLAEKRDRYPAELSGGQKQRVGIARALATRPKVLLSDEATSALDPETTEQILELLKKINTELGLTILFITHEMAVVKALADRVAVIEQGRIIEEGSTYDVFAAPRHEVTRRFVSTVTGGLVPDWLRARLHTEPAAGRSAALRLSFAGKDSQAVVSQIARELQTDVNILFGQIEAIAGQPFGTLVVSLDVAAERLDRLVRELATPERSARNLTVERLGYVA